MGCLRQIFSLIILILAFIGFQSIGGVEFCRHKINDFLHPQKAHLEKEARQIADFSMMPDGYKLVRTFNFMGVKALVANYNENDQKCLLLDTKGLIKIRKNDFYSEKVDKLLSEVISKFAYQAIRVEHLKVLSNGSFNGLGQEIPYIIFETDVIGLESEKMYGMFGIAQAPDGENDVVMSFSLDNDYDQIISESFFRNINYTR